MHFLDGVNGRSTPEKLYYHVLGSLARASEGSIPYLRRIQRFLFLPYCYLYLVNWEECKKGKLAVIGDFLYIYFVLKDFPDNYSICKLWDKPKSEWVYYYGSNYNPYQRHKLRRNIQPLEYQVLYEDKRVCQRFCAALGIPVPRLVAATERGEPLLEVINGLSGYPSNPSRIIAKPMAGKGGHAIYVLHWQTGRYRLIAASAAQEKLLATEKSRYLIQEYVRQHPVLDVISPSVNTIRVVT
jgi:hypothetical protein